MQSVALLHRRYGSLFLLPDKDTGRMAQAERKKILRSQKVATHQCDQARGHHAFLTATPG